MNEAFASINLIEGMWKKMDRRKRGGFTENPRGRRSQQDGLAVAGQIGFTEVCQWLHKNRTALHGSFSNLSPSLMLGRVWRSRLFLSSKVPFLCDGSKSNVITEAIIHTNNNIQSSTVGSTETSTVVVLLKPQVWSRPAQPPLGCHCCSLCLQVASCTLFLTVKI